MRYLCILCLLFLTAYHANSQQLPFSYKVPDTIKVVGVYATGAIPQTSSSHKMHLTMQADEVVLHLQKQKRKQQLIFYTTSEAKAIVAGNDVHIKKQLLKWSSNWMNEKVYVLYISCVQDSLANTTTYAAYVQFAKQQQWKWLGNITLPKRKTSMQHIEMHTTSDKNEWIMSSYPWLQRANGSWKKLDSAAKVLPVVRPMSDIDSLSQANKEIQVLKKQVPADSLQPHQGIFYTMLQIGEGKQVQLTDTVLVHYKGWLFANGKVFDQTKDKPVSFPLGRLIKGWQLGLPLCKVGGSIRLYLPSAFAYGLRNSASIPPHSVLVFDVQILAATPKKD